jgi:hypothetical protein
LANVKASIQVVENERLTDAVRWDENFDARFFSIAVQPLPIIFIYDANHQNIILFICKSVLISPSNL